MQGDRTPPRGRVLYGNLIVETGAGQTVVPILERSLTLRWRIADRALWLDEPAEGEMEPVQAPSVALRESYARSRLRWYLSYREGRFWVLGSERPLTRMGGVTLDPAAEVDWPGGVNLSWEGAGEIVVGVQRLIDIPRDTVHCPECGKAIRPRRIVYGAPTAFTAELVVRNVVGLGGCAIEPGQPTHFCPDCSFAFALDEDVLGASVFETYCDWIEARASRSGTLLVIVSNDDDGKKATLRFQDPQEVIVGRGGGCSIVLDGDEVESMHARIVRNPDGKLWIADLASDSGTFVNGERIQRPRPFDERDEIVIGPYTLLVTWKNLRP
jgi:hypothetical protein